ncbi:DUF4139 domain-containing protein [Nocardia crassostreae]|uniref:DUF4139 domain-containing protein n=1 Tax=Nocardia crassostreae TaxID=53428 RepID=UPI00082D0F8F|nr:DUF4139 domain-containing protein [Nocardia crassostreae]
MTTVDAPIVAVIVYPGPARITRRAVVAVEAGARQITLGGLPLGLVRDSVRVNGRGAASVVGVDVALQQHPRSLERRLAAHRKQREPDRRTVVVDLDVTAAGEIELDLSYVIDDARWTSSYDIRLRGEQLTLTWYAEITQSTGEDWPECELALSTARPAITAELPELHPWFLDRMLPPVPVAAAVAYGAPPPAPGGAMMPRSAPTRAEAAAQLDDFAAAPEPVVEHGAAATTYRPARAVAVPGDGTAHRATVAVIDLAAALDHVTAPVRGPEAFLRATAVNTSEHTLRPGRASVFHESEFVGTTTLEVWAPKEEIELNLGVDDRIRVERELVKRTAGKAVLGSSTRRELTYLITIGNYGRRATKVTVLDQIPVSRDDGILVKDVTVRPDPVQRTDLGELSWKLPLEPGATAEITVRFRVDLARGVELRGWRE